jgi:hypothetical protein
MKMGLPDWSTIVAPVFVTSSVPTGGSVDSDRHGSITVR